VEIPTISSIAAWNEASFAFEGLLKPVIFLTNCSEAARTSSSVTGGSKLKRGLIFLHILVGLEGPMTSRYQRPYFGSLGTMQYPADELLSIRSISQ
jgi:hypothetical protein